MLINQNFIVNHFLRCWLRHFTEEKVHYDGTGIYGWTIKQDRPFTEEKVHCDGTGIYGWTIKQDRKVATSRLIEQAIVKFCHLSTSLLQLFLRFFSDDLPYFQSIFKGEEGGHGYSFAVFDSVVIFGV